MPNPKRLKAILAKSSKTPDPAAAGPAGFTLIELLVAMVAASIVLAAVVSLFTTINKTYTKQNVAANIQQVARAGVDFMAQSIRMAGLDPNQTGDFGITVATETSITFIADLDMDGGVAGTGENISYFLNGHDLMSNLSAVPLVSNVTDLTFTYLAADDSILAAPVVDPAAIRTVQIALTVREPAGGSTTVTRSYATEVRCRNLGL